MKFLPMLFLVLAAGAADAMTIRSKSDLRLWQTAFDRTAPLSWTWEAGADAATLMLRRVREEGVDPIEESEFSFIPLEREPADSRRGTCELPDFIRAAPRSCDMVVEAALTQTSNDVVIAYEYALLAFVSGSGSDGQITVLAPGSRTWNHVSAPRLSGYDAAWWGLDGTSGYEILWKTPAGRYLVERSFEDVGVVDSVQLKFGKTGVAVIIR